MNFLNLFVFIGILGVLSISQALPRFQRKFPGNGRIAGGDIVTELGKYPYMLSLQWFGNHICGASLIQPNLALTAAHCVHGEDARALSVVGGVTDLRNTKPENVFKIKEMKIHPKFNEDGDYFNDIAILTLETEVTLGPNINIVPTDPLEQSLEGLKFEATGWGVTKSNGIIENELRQVELTAQSDESCLKIYDSRFSSEQFFCAGGENRDTCQGDTGGPVVDPITYIQYGISSWGFGCAVEEYPSVNVRLSKFQDFIQSIITANSIL